MRGTAAGLVPNSPPTNGSRTTPPWQCPASTACTPRALHCGNWSLRCASSRRKAASPASARISAISSAGVLRSAGPQGSSVPARTSASSPRRSTRQSSCSTVTPRRASAPKCRAGRHAPFVIARHIIHGRNGTQTAQQRRQHGKVRVLVEQIAVDADEVRLRPAHGRKQAAGCPGRTRGRAGQPAPRCEARRTRAAGQGRRVRSRSSADCSFPTAGTRRQAGPSARAGRRFSGGAWRLPPFQELFCTVVLYAGEKFAIMKK